MRRLARCCSSVARCRVHPRDGRSASRGVQYGIQDDAWLLDGPGTFEQRLDQLQQLGVDIVRCQHPLGSGRADAAGARARLDRSRVSLGGVRRRAPGPARARHQPVVTLLGTPAWANGGRKPNVAPTSATTFADFAYAAAKRYPFVRKWTIWNEPNQRLSLAEPSPSLYVKRLLNPAYAAIHRANPRRARRRRRHGAARQHRRRRAARVDPRHGGGAREARRVRAPPVPDAAASRRRSRGGCVDCDVISMANLRAAAQGGAPRLRQQADLADRVRLPDESARPVRRLPERAGDVRRRVGAARVPAAGRHDADPVPRPRRAEPRALPERPLHRARRRRSRRTHAFRFPLAQVSRRGSRPTLWGQIRPGKGARTYRLAGLDAGVTAAVALSLGSHARRYVQLVARRRFLLATTATWRVRRRRGRASLLALSARAHRHEPRAVALAGAPIRVVRGSSRDVARRS